MNIALSDTFAYCALHCFLNWFCCTVTFYWGLHLSDGLNTCCLMWKDICCSFCLRILFNHSLRPFQFAHQLCHFCLHMFFSCLRFCFFFFALCTSFVICALPWHPSTESNTIQQLTFTSEKIRQMQMPSTHLCLQMLCSEHTSAHAQLT